MMTRKASTKQKQQITLPTPWKQIDWPNYDWDMLNWNTIHSQVDFRGADLQFIWSTVPDIKQTSGLFQFFNMISLCLECNARLESGEPIIRKKRQPKKYVPLPGCTLKEDPPTATTVLELGPNDKGFKTSNNGVRLLIKTKKTFHELDKEEAESQQVESKKRSFRDMDDGEETEIENPEPKKRARKAPVSVAEPKKQISHEMGKEETKGQKPESKKRARKTTASATKPKGRKPKVAPESTPLQTPTVRSTMSQTTATQRMSSQSTISQGTTSQDTSYLSISSQGRSMNSQSTTMPSMPNSSILHKEDIHLRLDAKDIGKFIRTKLQCV